VTSCLPLVWHGETIRVMEGKSFGSGSLYTVYVANPCVWWGCPCRFWSKTIQDAYLPDVFVLGALAFRLLGISCVENEWCLLHA
jgi:hypothetical protein